MAISKPIPQQTYSPFLPICPETGHVLEIPVTEIDKENSKIIFGTTKYFSHVR